MTKKFVNSVKKNSQELKILGLAICIVFVTVFGFLLGTNSPILIASGGETIDYTKGNTLATKEVLEEVIVESISTYFEESSITDYISQDDMELLIAEITTGVLNSLPQDLLSEEEMDAVRNIVNEAIEEMAEEQNKKIKDEIQKNSVVITSELKEYVNDVVVPTLTATIQINSGAITDLRESLSEISNKYNSDKKKYNQLFDELKEQLDNIANDSVKAEEIVAVKETIRELSEVFEEYKSINSAEITTLAKELEELRTFVVDMSTRLEDLTKNQLEAFRQSMQDQIDANDALTHTQRAELEEQVNKSIADTNKSFREIADELEMAIAETASTNSKALNDFIANIYGNASGDVTIGDLLEQIELTAELSAEQKSILMEMIDNKYSAISAETKAHVEAVKESLEATIAENSASNAQTLKAFVASLYGDVTGDIKIGDLLDQIETTEELTVDQKVSLVDMINSKYDDATPETTAQAEEVKVLLEAAIAESSAAYESALNAFVASLYGDASGDVTIGDLLAQIEATAELTFEQKESLIEMVNAKSVEFTAKVDDVKTALVKEVADREKALEEMAISLTTSMETKVAELEQKVTQLINGQIETLRNSLMAQINTNKNLSEEQKAELEKEINILADGAATAEELALAVTELTAKITQSTEDSKAALNEAINNLLGEDASEGITIAELEQRISDADISPEQKQEILNIIANVYEDATADTTLKVEEAKNALQEEISRQAETFTNAVNSLQTQLETKLAELEIKVAGLIDSQLETLRSALLAQIETNKDLSDEMKEELEKEINILASTSATAEELSAAVADLTARISQNATDNQTALHEAINALLGDASEGITIAELEQRIADADISPEQKQEILDTIANVYANATADTTLKVEEAKNALQAEIDSQITELTNAMDSLRTELDTLISELRAEVNTLRDNLIAQIEADRNLSEAMKEELEDKINVLASTSATAEELSAAIAEMTAQIQENAQASTVELNEAIKALLGDASEGITIAELEQKIADADIADETKAALYAAIDSAFEEANDNVELKVSEVNSALQAEVVAREAAITTATTTMQTTLQANIDSLSSTVSANKTAQDNKNTALDQKDAELESDINELQTVLGIGSSGSSGSSGESIPEQIENISNALGGWTFELRGDGHLWAVQYNENGEVVLAKKLTFAE